MDKEPIFIRLLTPNDAEAFRTLRLEALEVHPEAFGASYEDEITQDVEFYRQRLANTLIIGAERDGQLVGMASLGIQAMQKMQHRGTVYGVYVRESERGQGISKQLMQMLIIAAQRLKIEQLELRVVSDNKPAKKLYESLEFEKFGVEPRAMKIDDQYFDEDFMVKFLRDRMYIAPTSQQHPFVGAVTLR